MKRKEGELLQLGLPSAKSATHYNLQHYSSL